MPAIDCQPFHDSTALRRDVIDACLGLRAIGFCIGTWGNISIRITEGMLITPSRLDYAEMQPDDLVVVSWEGECLSGHRIPSSETELHRMLLQHRPDLGALVHSHSPQASALAAAQRELPVCLEDVAQIIGGTVHCAPYTPGGRHRALAEAATAAIGSEATAVLLANHGPIVGGRDLAEALIAAQVLEKAAGVYLRAAAIGGVQVIPNDLVREERHRYLYKYGKEDPIEVKTR